MAEQKNVIMGVDSRGVIPRITTPIDLVLTDPPYGMAFQSNRAQTPEGKQFTQAIESDGGIVEAIELFYSVMGPIVHKLADPAELYIFTAWHVLDWWMEAVKNLAFLHPDGTLDKENGWCFRFPEGKPSELVMRDPKGFDTGIRLKQMLIWDKGYPGQGDLTANWGCGHEVILYLKKGRRPVPERRSAILGFDRIPAGQNIHPTEKPVPLLEKLITFSTDPGAFVVDPFSGSGSTSVAAKQTGRNSLAFEIDERYIARSQERLKTQGLWG